jgi:hypothetical protein
MVDGADAAHEVGSDLVGLKSPDGYRACDGPGIWVGKLRASSLADLRASADRAKGEIWRQTAITCVFGYNFRMALL